MISMVTFDSASADIVSQNETVQSTKQIKHKEERDLAPLTGLLNLFTFSFYSITLQFLPWSRMTSSDFIFFARRKFLAVDTDNLKSRVSAGALYRNVNNRYISVLN